MKYTVRSLGIALVCGWFSLAPVAAQQTDTEQKGSSVSARDLANEYADALQAFRERFSALEKKVKAETDALEQQRDDIEKEYNGTVQPLQKQQEDLARTYQQEMDEAGDKYQLIEDYNKAIMQIRAKYDSQLKKLSEDIEQMYKSFEPRIQKIDNAIQKIYKKYEPEHNQLQKEMEKVSGKYDKLIKDNK